MIRTIIFWTHLVCGVVAGIVVFTMSLTGVVLTYERQINNWAAESHYLTAPDANSRFSLDQLLEFQQLAQPDQTATAVIITNNPGAPVSFRTGRSGALNLNPYTGETMSVAAPALASFFSAVTGFHRWFSIEGENRAIARQITGVSNVMFLFLVMSGMYLWLPALWKWGMFKVRLVFRSNYPSSKIRDFHWHHIFGIWAAIPLLAVVYSGAVISYPWAANLMYMAFGAEIPAVPAASDGPLQTRDNLAVGQPANNQAVQREPDNALASEPQSGSAQTGIPAGATTTVYKLKNRGEIVSSPIFRSLEELLAKVQSDLSDDWQRLTLNLPAANQTSIQVEIDRGNGAQAFKRHTLSLDRITGHVIAVQNFADIPEAQRLRGITRFLHTGEVLGFWGQTVAGLASFAALFMVWTGFALSWRRLIQPLFK
jgi:uncharacterized iron-regulated membrane protein